MAKGGGKSKGRPRKHPDLVIARLPEVRSHCVKEAESSIAAESRGAGAFTGAVPSLKQRIELEISSSVVKQAEAKMSEEEKEVVADKIEDRKGSSLRGRGMNLSYVAPTMKQGKPSAQLRKEELLSEAEKWKHAIILYVIGESPTITYLKAYLQTQCNIMGAIDIYYHNEGIFW